MTHSILTCVSIAEIYLYIFRSGTGQRIVNDTSHRGYIRKHETEKQTVRL